MHRKHELLIKEKLVSNVVEQDQGKSIDDLCEAVSLCHRRVCFIPEEDLIMSQNFAFFVSLPHVKTD